MIFHPKHTEPTEDRFLFQGPACSVAHSCLRKAAPVDGDCRRAGWAKRQIEALW